MVSLEFENISFFTKSTPSYRKTYNVGSKKGIIRFFEKCCWVCISLSFSTSLFLRQPAISLFPPISSILSVPSPLYIKVWPKKRVTTHFVYTKYRRMARVNPLHTEIEHEAPYLGPKLNSATARLTTKHTFSLEWNCTFAQRDQTCDGATRCGFCVACSSHLFSSSGDDRRAYTGARYSCSCKIIQLGMNALLVATSIDSVGSIPLIKAPRIFTDGAIVVLRR